jgi:F-type H+-transporting ATPase subunit b
MDGRIFGLDLQLGFDVLLQAICVLILFAFLSYLLFEPVKKILKDRQERVAAQIADATKNLEDAEQLREEYEAKLRDIEKEAHAILADARKKSLEQEEAIVAAAKEEAHGIVQRANKEIDLEKSRVQDDVKNEMIDMAKMMAGKIITESIDEKKQQDLVTETLEEMGDDTWQS